MLAKVQPDNDKRQATRF
uniref:Uncharacterized protein n=1 Tax=Anopheles quadriannulatus TaxID=34691 RepID=A0A182XS82_ANOQN